MGGYSLGDCIEEQRGINGRYHHSAESDNMTSKSGTKSGTTPRADPRRKQHVQTPNQMLQVVLSTTTQARSWGSE
jgi:hypothetical protein